MTDDELRERLTRIEGMMAGLAAHISAFTAEMRKSRELDPKLRNIPRSTFIAGDD